MGISMFLAQNYAEIKLSVFSCTGDAPKAPWEDVNSLLRKREQPIIRYFSDFSNTQGKLEKFAMRFNPGHAQQKTSSQYQKTFKTKLKGFPLFQ